jgi:hypothetical protein
MFQLFPKRKREWLRVLLFPFQAFVVVGYFVHHYFFSSLPYGYRGELSNLNVDMLFGYAVCFLVLLVVGIAQIAKGHRMLGIFNMGLAALAAKFAMSLQFAFA